MLFFTSRVGKAEVDEFDLLVFDQLEYVFCSHSPFLVALIWLLSPVAVKKAFHSLPQTKKAFDLKNRSKTPLSSARHGSVPGYDFITQILWGPQGVRPLGTRSEERRVGKE